MTMSIGMNTNIQHQGKVYHVQTEDGGQDHPIITTLLFKDGVVFASKRTDYKDLLKTPSCRETVTEMMKEQHKNIIRDLIAGRIAGVRAENESDADTSAPEQGASLSGRSQEEVLSQPSSEKEGKQKTLDDLILDYLEEKKKNSD